VGLLKHEAVVHLNWDSVANKMFAIQGFRNSWQFSLNAAQLSSLWLVVNLRLLGNKHNSRLGD
jgi:hypothetical protein